MITFEKKYFRVYFIIGVGIVFSLMVPSKVFHFGSLVAGLALTVTTAVYVFLMIKREEKIERLVEERTEELKKSNQALEQEVIQRKKTEELLAKKALEAQLIHQATAMASQTNSLEEVLQGCVDIVCQLTSWPVGHVYLPAETEEKKLLPVNIWYCADRKSYANFIDVTMKTLFDNGKGLPGRILESHQPAWIRDVHEDDNFPRAKLCKEIGVKGAFGFPIMVSGEVAAVLEFFNYKEMNPDEDILDIVKSVGEQVGRVLERKKAETQLKQEKERLQIFQNVTVNREIEMIELKKENNELCRRLGEVPPYDVSFLEKKSM